MLHSCVYCGKYNAFKSSLGLDKHLAFCSKVPGNKEKTRQLGLPKRILDASLYNQRKRAHYQLEDQDSHGSAGNDNYGEGPSQPQDDNPMPDEEDIFLVSTKPIYHSTWLIRLIQAQSEDAQPPSLGEQAIPTGPIRSAHSGRAIRVPRRLMDFVPHGDMSLSHVPRPSTPSSAEGSPPPSTTPPRSIETNPNKLGVFRQYPHIPSWHPEAGQSLDSICDTPTLDAPPPPPVNPNVIHELYLGAEPLPHEPFSSRTAAILMEAYHSGSGQKSAAHLDALAKAIYLSPEFDINELNNFSAERESARLAAFLRDETIEHPFRKNDGWKEVALMIRVPVKGQHYPEEEAPQIKVSGLFHRQLMSVIKTVYGNEISKGFHFTPFKQFWIPVSDNPDQSERLYSEIYTSDIAHEYQQSVDALPRLEGDELERVIIPLMFASDSAHLTNFGSASVWPIYVGFGSQTKYDRAKPSAHATHHLAYVPSVS